ncbi:phosphonate metabolism protein/1,5-bisphosphokinase (PRPP-forming) PhnN [Nitratireductor aquimarinus]|uniref:phosphonate metabolism protein/1,5-bisphosphokinase (PRPP-forming) PhnN n=1 Tax=Alphaproteobacteria TaxID=28211 RepID=UPI0019D41211|nr:MULTISPECIES: phosphonate metabolism protein/1,5-bisphosphokinase (PRPP-forming) PhnN [Alphaproteobacteria]MBY6023166.1 phosphonate metabolism protein/1,5-bisphosphokinase (PRPP-forming) PhnN [Nitratireductor sp. DP7N14-4]MBN7758373.1 phosphonate metabolism protein/1,5-bisphosphokinase (PRPP-forming) PhnN [Nitratireductor aquimarinus]MBN7761742.1 phosphonate metabolism protein/1,5-bisphosphokinase (PRPP-forming) PhnN [Nitratireductor aquibiodomus]MBN7775627.1 phosphonate metabolism protein/1
MRASATLERVIDEQDVPIRHGVFIAVAGPSGAGKDSVMDYARQRLGPQDSDVTFVRRVITREMDGAGEAHDCLTRADFDEAEAKGAFAVSWEANGLKYGLPASVDDIVRDGHVAVANVSRAVIPLLRERYGNVVAVIVTAARDVLAERLSSRGRETREEVLARLERAHAKELTVEGATVIDNSGTLEEAGERFQDVLRRAAAWSAVSDSV